MLNVNTKSHLHVDGIYGPLIITTILWNLSLCHANIYKLTKGKDPDYFSSPMLSLRTYDCMSGIVLGWVYMTLSYLQIQVECKCLCDIMKSHKYCILIVMKGEQNSINKIQQKYN